MKLAVVAIVVAGLPLSAPALADSLMCGPVEPGQIQLDGLEDDWVDVQGIEAGAQAADLSLTFKCNTEGGRLFLLIDVRDNYFVRTRHGHPGEDHVELTLGARHMTLYPGNARHIPTKVSLPGVRATSALQEKGWAIELQVPLASIGQRGATPIPFVLTVDDCDSKATFKTEKQLTAQGNIVFAEGDATLDAFLNDRSLKRADIWLDKPLATGKKSGARLVLAGRYLAIIGEGYVFLELPVHVRADIKEVKLVDLAGDGRESVLLRYLERGGGGARELLAAYRPGEEQIQRIFAAEVAKSVAAGRIEDKVAYVKRGRATDIVIQPGPSSVARTAWQESRADDAIPIMLPWDNDKRARYQFSGDEYKRAP
jgi:hypothetical protein